jgi:hypothetical protein
MVSCSPKPSLEDIHHLNGFWEIQKAETPYETKSYKINQMVDYIQVEDTLGFRKKMQPSLLGKYQSSQNREEFTVREGGDSLLLVYRSQYDSWTETLISIEENEFVVKNDEDFIYTYKRHKNSKINLDDEK